eukprot:5944902-Alexandrium_andersonii.AAC.3
MHATCNCSAQTAAAVVLGCFTSLNERKAPPSTGQWAKHEAQPSDSNGINSNGLQKHIRTANTAN